MRNDLIRYIKYTFAFFRITPGESPILRLPSISKMVWFDYSWDAKIGDSPGLMPAIFNSDWWEMIFLDISNTPLPSSALGLGNRRFCVSRVYLRWSGLITRETQHLPSQTMRLPREKLHGRRKKPWPGYIRKNYSGDVKNHDLVI